jgi:hypothetical protein
VKDGAGFRSNSLNLADKTGICLAGAIVLDSKIVVNTSGGTSKDNSPCNLDGFVQGLEGFPLHLHYVLPLGLTNPGYLSQCLGMQ